MIIKPLRQPPVLVDTYEGGKLVSTCLRESLADALWWEDPFLRKVETRLELVTEYL